MKTDRFTYEGVPTPCYIIEEDLLRRNLELIRDVSPFLPTMTTLPR